LNPKFHWFGTITKNYLMQKTLFFSTIILIMSLGAVAQEPHQTAYETKANELLQKASEKIRSFTTLEADFSYKMENTEMDILETMEGKLFSREDKYRMLVGDNVFISDGSTVWNYIDDLYEIHVNYVDNTEGGLTPTSLLENFETEFRGKYIRQESHQGRSVDIIDLIPTSPQSFFKYRVALDANDQMIVYTIAYDRHGGTYTYTIDDLKTGHSLSDQLFVFDKADFPEDAEVIDLR